MGEKDINKNVLKRWAKDYDLPIKIYSEPYFSYLVELYNDYLGTNTKLELLKETLSKFNSEEDFLSYYHSVRDKIIETMKNVQEFNDFNTADLSKYNISTSYPKTDIYKSNLKDRYFLSIDLVKANYQALKYINSEIVLNTNSYEEFIGLFTDLEYMTKSKYLRQVIFGNINPKRQVKVERYLIEKVIDYVTPSIVNKDKIQMASSDEVVFELSVEEAVNFSKDTNDLVKKIKTELNIDIDIEIFKLVSVDSYYAKEFINKDGYELKGVSQVYFPQVYKKYNNLEITEKDLVFIHEGQLAKFLEPIL